MAKELTERQALVLAKMIEYQAKHQTAANTRNIGDDLGIAYPNGVLCHFKALETKGYVTHHGDCYVAKRTPDYWPEWLAALPQQERADLFTEVLRQFIQRTEKT